MEHVHFSHGLLACHFALCWATLWRLWLILPRQHGRHARLWCRLRCAAQHRVGRARVRRLVATRLSSECLYFCNHAFDLGRTTPDDHINWRDHVWLGPCSSCCFAATASAAFACPTDDASGRSAGLQARSSFATAAAVTTTVSATAMADDVAAVLRLQGDAQRARPWAGTGGSGGHRDSWCVRFALAF